MYEKLRGWRVWGVNIVKKMYLFQKNIVQSNPSSYHQNQMRISLFEAYFSLGINPTQLEVIYMKLNLELNMIPLCTFQSKFTPLHPSLGC